MMADVDEGVAELFLMEEEVYSHGSCESSKYCGLIANSTPDVRGHAFFWTEQIAPESVRASYRTVKRCTRHCRARSLSSGG